VAIRVALGEDSLIVREGVRQLLAVDAAVEIVAAVSDLDSLRDACEELAPDVVLTDIRMPPTNTDETRASASPRSCATPTPGSAWSC
jgi:DNA-binding NarL/FixJ family response regulator